MGFNYYILQWYSVLDNCVDVWTSYYNENIDDDDDDDDDYYYYDHYYYHALRTSEVAKQLLF